MNEHDQDDKQARMKKLLQQALPPVDTDAEPARDLWPVMLGRLDADSAAQLSTGQAGFNWAPFWVWFDRALAAGLVLLVASFPASIPLLLYYL
jgi:hypothetical protein